MVTYSFRLLRSLRTVDVNTHKKHKGRKTILQVVKSSRTQGFVFVRASKNDKSKFLLKQIMGFGKKQKLPPIGSLNHPLVNSVCVATNREVLVFLVLLSKC
jgi:hypothetical protein